MYWLIERNYDDGEFSHWSVKNKTDKHFVPRGHDGLSIEGIDIPKEYGKVELDSDGKPQVVENLDLKEVKEKWVEIDQEIVNDAVPVFKTSNRESLLAFVDSFQLRIMAASKFSNKGLVAEFTIGSFTAGDALDTATKVKNYHIEVLVDLDDKRNSKILEYLTLKASKGL